ncbi:MAG TPA: 3'-5' exonuclease [Myxococcota bacterium]|nr:3'-5' exonuclease [Myxococcota bacterium]
MHPIVEEELALLARVHRVLDTRSASPRPDESAILADLERLREQILSQREAKDAMSLAEQWHRQSALLRQLRSSAEAPEVDPRSPYFAHMRLESNGEERDLCLGRATRIESGIRIVDWRHAPISRVFYRYQQGDEYEEEFGGRTRSGTVTARRTVRIRDGALERVEAPEGVFVDEHEPKGWQRVEVTRPRLAGGEGSALRAHPQDATSDRRLGTDLEGGRRRADKRLPEITSLIDAAQFDLIARPGGFVAIRGSAGSGKTTVALHRIAYLAYDDPRIDSERTLFVVFSPALREYVRHVLPSLGVTRVRIATFREWAHEMRLRHFPKLPAEPRSDAPEVVQRLLLHPGLADALERHIAEHPGPRTPQQALDDWASVQTRPDLLRRCCEARAPGSFRAGEIERASQWLKRRNEEIFAWLQQEPEVEAALEPEDDAILLRAFQLRVGPLRGRGGAPQRYRHVAIDEVQDFALLEVRVLVDCVDDDRCITLAGDTQQHLSTHSGFTSWGDFLAGLGIEGRSLETLRVNYRSTREIMDFAQQTLGSLREDDSPPESPKSGPPVELFRFTDRGACVAFLGDALRELSRAEPLASVAVLTPNPDSSQAFFEGLTRGDLPSLRRVERQDFTFAPGVEVTEVEQAKGLEFDYVVLVDVSPEHYPDAPAARRLIHVGATRAVHQLWLCCVGTPSPIVAGAWR